MIAVRLMHIKHLFPIVTTTMDENHHLNFWILHQFAHVYITNNNLAAQDKVI